MWGALAGPLTILLIATRSTKVEQGYYYTFSSLSASQVFFKFGLLTFIAACHEFAFLSCGELGADNAWMPPGNAFMIFSASH